MTRRNIIVVAAAIAVLLLAWYLLLWSPKSSQISEARERRDASEAEAQQLELRLAQLRDAAQRAPELTATLDRVRSAVPAEPELPDLLLAANAAAKAAGVEYISVSPQPPATDVTGPARIGVTVTVEARYGPLLDFVQRLLDMPRVLVIDSMQVSPAQGSDVLSVSITGRTFTTWIPGTPGAPAAPPAAPAAPAPPPADSNQVAAPVPEGAAR